MGKYCHWYRLIRRKGGSNAFACTTPLIKKADGTKFGKRKMVMCGWIK